uniref:Putative ribonuclease H-like domain-containing protein n=1 Tax=Tanacetum cinerariifolium TaxID=118510 RepID=A0A6L2K7M0_TANCI|nr:putative ribonuclease H-like domain-containing protein [Tanacetum cinerariifolium]
MTGNISYHSENEPYDGWYVSFGQGGCKITSKGTIKTGKLEFENVYFVKDLKYNLFSVSQICDNKNSVLFTDSECIVLGRNFKLTDDIDVLLRTPRQHNMCIINLNNIVPHKDLTCLVAKISADEYMLWHRRLGHLNFKTMNKLVRHNLVRGLPTKCFKNDHNCTACLKGKQHKASCKTKLVNSVTKPLHTLHMDLFGPTSVSSLNHKWYCLVVTDDFSRFTWTFFLKTKDETSGILRNFITEIENLKELKVKIIRSDNGGDEGYFIGYSMSSKAFKVFNKRTKRVEENMHVDFLENKPIEKGDGPIFDVDSLTNSMNYVPVVVAGTNSTNFSDTKEAAGQDVKKDVSSLRYIVLPNWLHEIHLETSTSNAQDACITDAPESSGISNPTATLTNPPTDHMETLAVETPIPTNVWSLVDCPKGVRPIGTKWVLKNKKDERGIVIRNKARLVAQGHTQEEEIDYDEMDVKSAFLYGTIDEEVYVMQPPGFQDPEFPARVYKVEKEISSNPQLCREFEALMHEKFQMSAMGKLNFFLGLPDIMFAVCACARHQVTPKECHLHAVKRIFRYLKGHPKLGLWYPKESPFDLVAYSDSDYGGATQDRKSTTRGSFCDYHNMIPILEKYEHNQDFHQIVDFIEASHIRYALTFNPTVYVFHIRQFWSTARIETTEEGTKILATVDGKLRTVYESSIRRNLKLNDEVGISSLPDAEIFENLTLIGYNISPNPKFTFQKGQFSHQWKYLIHTIMQCLSPKSTGFNEFSSNIATAHVCLATNRVFNFSKMIFDGMVRNVNNKVSKFLMYPRTVPLFDSMLVPQGEGSGIPTEPHHTPTSEASQSSQHELLSPSLPPVTTKPLPTDRENIPKTSTLPSDSTPRVTSLAADEGSMQHQIQELMALCTSLQRQQTELVLKFEAQELEINSLKAIIKLLEDKNGGVIEQSRDDAPFKGRSLNEGEETAERVSDDTEEMATVLTSMDAASILTSGGVQVVPTAAEVATATVSIPTGSGVVPTASPTILTAALIFTTATESTPYTRRKGKEKMVESETPKKKKVQEQIDVQLIRELEEEMAKDAQRMNEQIAQDAKIARIHAEEELQMLIDGLDMNNETIAKYLQEYYQFAIELPIERRIELISNLVKYQDNYAKVLKFQTQQRKPLSRKQQRDFYISVLKSQAVWKQFQDFIPIGSKEEAERFKRKGLRLEQDSTKKVKTTEEVPEEKLKEMMHLILVEEVYVEALQVKHPIIDWEVHTEGQRIYWKIIRLGGSSASYQFFVDLLKHLDREDLNKLWTLVKQTLNIRPATSNKEMKLWVELKRLMEAVRHMWSPSCDLQRSRNIHASGEVEKDYPLRKGCVLSWIAICLGLRFVTEELRFVFKDIAFCLGSIAFCLLQRSCILSMKHCVLPKSRNLRFVSEALRFA